MQSLSSQLKNGAIYGAIPHALEKWMWHSNWRDIVMYSISEAFVVRMWKFTKGALQGQNPLIVFSTTKGSTHCMNWKFIFGEFIPGSVQVEAVQSSILQKSFQNILTNAIQMLLVWQGLLPWQKIIKIALVHTLGKTTCYKSNVCKTAFSLSLSYLTRLWLLNFRTKCRF